MEDLEWGQLLDFMPEAGNIQDATMGSATITEVRVLSVGKGESTVAYRGTAPIDADFAIEVEGDDGAPVEHFYREKFEIGFSGASKVTLSPDASDVAAVTRTEVNITSVVALR